MLDEACRARRVLKNMLLEGLEYRPEHALTNVISGTNETGVFEGNEFLSFDKRIDNAFRGRVGVVAKELVYPPKCVASGSSVVCPIQPLVKLEWLHFDFPEELTHDRTAVRFKNSSNWGNHSGFGTTNPVSDAVDFVDTVIGIGNRGCSTRDDGTDLLTNWTLEGEHVVGNVEKCGGCASKHTHPLNVRKVTIEFESPTREGEVTFRHEG
jgi:hypothetical protein